jgi:5-methylcytosine-specific restriction endonuclease McrA
MCLEQEQRYVAASVVDHVIPIAQAPERRLDETNLMSLCRYHHAKKSSERDGWLGNKVKRDV